MNISLTVGTKFTVQDPSHPSAGRVLIITKVGDKKYSYRKLDGGTTYKANVNTMSVVSLSKKEFEKQFETGHWALV